MKTVTFDEALWRMVPVKPTAEMIEAAAAAHYGKRRSKQSGGAIGISMTVEGADYSFITAFKRFWKGALAASPLPNQPTDAPAPVAPAALREALLRFLYQDSDGHWRIVGPVDQDVTSIIDPLLSAAPQQPVEVKREAVAVSVKPMRLSDGRADYYVAINVEDREVTPHVFREEYKAVYHAALYRWLFEGGEEPEVVEFNLDDFPAQVPPPPADMAALRKALGPFAEDGGLYAKERKDSEIVRPSFRLGQLRAAHRALLDKPGVRSNG